MNTELLKSISKREWLLVFLILAIFTVIASLPFVVGKLASDGAYFAFNTTTSPWDTYTYIAWIEQAKQGQLLFQTLYSTEGGTGTFFHPLFLLMGMLAKLFHISSLYTYQIFRIVGIIFLIPTLYLFFASFFSEKKYRLLSLILVLFGSGFGFINTGFSVDVWMTEWSLFLNSYQTLLNIYSLTFILLILLAFIHAKTNYHKILFISLVLNLLVLIHPYYFIPVLVILGMWTLSQTKRNELKPLGVYLYIILFSFPAIIWQSFVLNKEPVLAIWLFMQTQVPVSSLIEYLSGVGMVSIFLLAGIALIYRRKLKEYNFLLLWFASVLAILVIPVFVNIQRKFVLGFQIPIAAISALGLLWFSGNLQFPKIGKQILLLAVILFLFTTNAFIISKDIQMYGEKLPPYVYSKEEIESIRWLGDNSSKDDIILAGNQLSNLIPGLASRKVYYGHYDQTVNYNLKYQIAFHSLVGSKNFKDPLQTLVQQENISYIVVDPEVRSWGGLDVRERTYLKLAYDNSDVQIYEVLEN